MGLTQIHGDLGEKAACKYLKKHGYKILVCNYRKTYGEIDIIAQKKDMISFVEVKTRSNTDYGTAAEAVTYQKQQKLIRTAKAYIVENGLDTGITFDVIEVYHEGRKVVSVHHIENAFYA